MLPTMKERAVAWLDNVIGELCRNDGGQVHAMRMPEDQVRLLVRRCLTIGICAALYGLVFGLWRSPDQALYSAIKLPLLLFAVVLASGIVNTMLAQIMNASLSMITVCQMMLTGMALTSLILASLAPVVFFFTIQMPSPAPDIVGLQVTHPAVAPSMRVFKQLLVMHIAVIGFAGIAGNIRLYAMLKSIAPSRAAARRIMMSWLLVSGFVGCELSWLFSPFICKPNFPPHLIARTYWEGNFYEHLYHALIP